MERIRYTPPEKLPVPRTILKILTVIPLGAAGMIFLYGALGFFLTALWAPFERSVLWHLR